MKKYILLIAIFLTVLSNVNAQVYNNVGNTLQRAQTGSTYIYRFNLGVPGFWSVVGKNYVDSLVAAHSGTSYTAGYGLNLISNIFKIDTASHPFDYRFGRLTGGNTWYNTQIINASVLSNRTGTGDLITFSASGSPGTGIGNQVSIVLANNSTGTSKTSFTIGSPSKSWSILSDEFGNNSQRFSIHNDSVGTSAFYIDHFNNVNLEQKILAPGYIIPGATVTDVLFANGTHGAVTSATTTNPLTFNYGFTGQPYTFNGSSAVTSKIDTVKIQTVDNFKPLGSTYWLSKTATTLPSSFTSAPGLLSASGGTFGTNAFNSTAFVQSVSGTTSRLTSTGGVNPVLDISSTFENTLAKLASNQTFTGSNIFTNGFTLAPAGTTGTIIGIPNSNTVSSTGFVLNSPNGSSTSAWRFQNDATGTNLHIWGAFASSWTDLFSFGQNGDFTAIGKGIFQGGATLGTSSTVGYVWTATNTSGAGAWAVAASPVSFANNEVPSGSINSSNTAYTLAHTPLSGSVNLFRNGVKQISITDYTISGTSITWSYAPTTGDTLTADYRY